MAETVFPLCYSSGTSRGGKIHYRQKMDSALLHHHRTSAAAAQVGASMLAGGSRGWRRQSERWPGSVPATGFNKSTSPVCGFIVCKGEAS